MTKKGCCTWLNLTEQAEKYLASRFKGKVDSWSLLANYTYWTDRHYYYPFEYPIQATVLELRCDATVTKKERQRRRRPIWARKFEWNISRPIATPFDLLVNVSVPMIEGSKSHRVELNLNNKEIIILKEKKPLKFEVMSRATSDQNEHAFKVLTQSCSFIATARFKGWFGFHKSETRGDDTHWDALPITVLQNATLGLLITGKDTLAYNITGTYIQRLRLPLDELPERS